MRMVGSLLKEPYLRQLSKQGSVIKMEVLCRIGIQCPVPTMPSLRSLSELLFDFYNLDLVQNILKLKLINQIKLRRK